MAKDPFVVEDVHISAIGSGRWDTAIKLDGDVHLKAKNLFIDSADRAIDASSGASIELDGAIIRLHGKIEKELILAILNEPNLAGNQNTIIEKYEDRLKPNGIDLTQLAKKGIDIAELFAKLARMLGL